MSLLPSSMHNTRRGYALAQWLLQDVQYVANILSTLLGDTRSFRCQFSAPQVHAVLDGLRHRSGWCHAGHNQIIATLALVNSTVCPRLHADFVSVSPLCASLYLKGGLIQQWRGHPCVMRAGAGAVHLLWTGHRVCCQQRRAAAAPAAPAVQRHKRIWHEAVWKLAAGVSRRPALPQGPCLPGKLW